MRLGMVGLGRMGANMIQRLLRGGHSCVVYDLNSGRWRAKGRGVLSASLYARFRSRQEQSFAERLLSAMRHKFGGHVERPTGG